MNKYDVVIVGGGTAGVSCAWNAGKLGLKTLIIEQNSFLGGSITSSLVIPAMKTSENSINNDFFNEFYKKLNLPYNKNLNIEILKRSTTNRILSLKINNIEFKGTDIYNKLSLRSTDFKIELLGKCKSVLPFEIKKAIITVNNIRTIL